MLRLSRVVRFCVNPDAAPDEGPNGFAGRPSMRGLGRYYELRLVAVGEADARTGYLANIKDLDAAARGHAIPLISEACARSPGIDPATLMAPIGAALEAALRPRLESVRLSLTPYYSLEMSPQTPDRVTIRQRFDLSAAHRLHAPSLSDEENRRVFGHCNNPAGHGHNYQFEPAVEVEVAPGGAAFTLQDLERVADEVVVSRFDHTHLNEDTEEFGGASGVLPSVENIARVFHGLLEPAIDAASDGRARLSTVTVWETDRTSCTYPA